jgi:hypothetical protein
MMFVPPTRVAALATVIILTATAAALAMSAMATVRSRTALIGVLVDISSPLLVMGV